jgi:hypothetical protein
MLAGDDLQAMYALAHFLYPDAEVAFAITFEAAEWLALLPRLQGPPPWALLGEPPRRLSAPILCLPGLLRARTRARTPAPQPGPTGAADPG